MRGTLHGMPTLVVKRVTLVDGTGAVRTIDNTTEILQHSTDTPASSPLVAPPPPPLLLQALQAHLGVLGVLLEVTLEVVPQFKVRIQQTVVPEAYMLNGSFLDDCGDYLWIYAGWYPHLHKVVLRTGAKVPVTVDGNCSTDFLIPPASVSFYPQPRICSTTLMDCVDPPSTDESIHQRLLGTVACCSGGYFC